MTHPGLTGLMKSLSLPRNVAWRIAMAALGVLTATTGARAQKPTPEEIRIHTEDVTRYLGTVPALRRARTYNDSAALIFTRYYLPATPGLRSFIRDRVGSPFELLDQMQSRPGYYAHLPRSLREVGTSRSSILAAFRRFEQLYPDAVFTDVYFVVGRMNSGGTTTPGMIVIGAEMYAKDSEAPSSELNEWELAVLRDTSLLTTIAVHELMHINQPPASGPRTLLRQSLIEGGADLVAELVTGRNINAHVHAWANPREGALWEEFRGRMEGTSMAGWLYDSRPRDRPADLGYWMGYRIARAYYDRASDKARAIRDILTVTDPAEFLRRSGYQPSGS
ncbi:MAG TPA: hypothetical protein VF613_17905 [Longimicrobium sp.]|jgi:hypothetical protein